MAEKATDPAALADLNAKAQSVVSEREGSSRVARGRRDRRLTRSGPATPFLSLQHTEQVATHRDPMPVGCDLLGVFGGGGP